MKKRVNCPECNRQMALVGLRWHRITKHNIWPDKTNVVLGNSSLVQANAHQIPYQSVNSDTPAVQNETKFANIANLADMVDNTLSERITLPQTARTAMQETPIKEHDTQYCAECRQREYKIIDLEHELSQAHKSHAALQEKINANNSQPIEIPDLHTVIQHCESGECRAHAKQWDQIKARIVREAYDNLPPESIPDKVVESEGLRRGFIPKKIIIQVPDR